MSGKNSEFTKFRFSDFSLYSLLAAENCACESTSRTKDFSTRIPEKASCTKVVMPDSARWISSDFRSIKLLT